MQAILDSGLRIPADIAVAGYGNVLYSRYLGVPRTSVDQGTEGIGRHAAEMALNLIDSTHPGSPQAILLPPKLVVRDSSKRLQ